MLLEIAVDVDEFEFDADCVACPNHRNSKDTGLMEDEPGMWDTGSTL